MAVNARMHSNASPVELKGETTAYAAARAGFLSLVLLSCGHFFIDLYSGALGALQPLLVEKHGLSLTQVGILGGLLVFSSSVMQPAYGYLSDRFHTRLFTVLAPAVAGVFISSLGVAPAYRWLAVMVLLGGAGIASFHPQASSRATFGVEETRRGRAMAVFISSGALGMAIGPTFFSVVTGRLGLDHMYWAAVPGIVISTVLFLSLPAAPVMTPRSRTRFDLAPLRAVWKPLTTLYFLVFIRSILQVTFAQFLPLYLHLEKGYSVQNANYALSAYLAAGAAGGFLGGHLSDRFGGRFVILVSMIASVPFLLAFFLMRGPVSLLGLIVGGLILLFTIPVNVVMAQELAPGQAGTVSALMMGFAWGTAGVVFIPLTGWASDLLSLQTVMTSLTLFPVIGFFLTWKLPR